MKTIILLFPIVVLLVCQILDVEAINYTQGVCDHTQVSECTNQTQTIRDRDKQIADLQITDTLSISVALLFGGVAVYSEIKRRQNNTKLRDLISSETNRISNVINDKKDEKQTQKVSGSMNLDFSMFLLNYLQRYFLKSHEIVNILLLITTVIIASLAIIATISPKIVDSKMLIISELTLAVLFLVVVVYLPHYSKKGNEKILKIEKKIIRNYDYINGKSDDEKDCILEEFHRVLGTEKKDPETLLEHLSRPSKK